MPPSFATPIPTFEGLGEFYNFVPKGTTLRRALHASEFQILKTFSFRGTYAADKIRSPRNILYTGWFLSQFKALRSDLDDAETFL